MAITKSSVIGITGILVGIFGVIGPIGWDYYKTKSEIELKVIDSNVIIERPKKLDGLVITYGGEKLDELSKTTFILSNTGRTPLLKRDVVQPVCIEFSPTSDVIDAKIESTMPRDLGATIQLNRNARQIVLDVPLLNPGDRIEFSALAKSSKIEFDASARIAGITSVSVIKEAQKEHASKATPWTVYPVGFFSALLFLASLVGVTQAPAELRTRRTLRNGTFTLPSMNSQAECLEWVDSRFFFTTAKERGTLKCLIKTLPDRQEFSVAYRTEILNGVQTLVDSAMPNLPMALGIIFISIIGGWYVLANIQ